MRYLNSVFSMKGLYLLFVTLFYLYLVLRVVKPSLVGHQSDVVKKAEETFAIQGLSKPEAKKLIFSHIGKSDNMILVDRIMTDAKDILKFSPIVLSIIMRSQYMYLSYAMPLFSYFALTKILKNTVQKTRPDNLSNKSFPSGHSSSAFIGATFLSMQFGPVVAIPVLGLASAVAISRVYCERHTILDIVFGSLIGIISALYANKVALKCLSSFTFGAKILKDTTK
jgi:membrane-associated phospholipid phosphatase